MQFRKKSIYSDHVFPHADRDTLLIYGFLGVVFMIMLALSFSDAKIYRASILTASQQKILVQTAYAKIGAPYVLGADVPPGRPPEYDCSSLMVDIFDNIGITLPRISRDQALVGKTIPFEDVTVGDLLFFDTADSGQVTHVGMVTKLDSDGTPMMVNANSVDGQVKEERVSGKYWRNTFVTAKRINELTKKIKSTQIERIDEDDLTAMPPTEMADPRVQEAIEENEEATDQIEESSDSDPSLSSKPSFEDIPDSYLFKDAIEQLAEQNIIKGTSDTTFEPFRALTRAELLKISMKANKTSQVGKSVNLYDIKGHWVESFVKTAVAKGYIQGYPDDTFRPDKPVTRAEGAKIIIEVAQAKDKLKTKKNFDDIPIDSWIDEYASLIKQENLLPLNGNTFNPNAPLSRGEASYMIYKLSLIR